MRDRGMHLLLAAGLALGSNVRLGPPRPHLISILQDDLGWYDSGINNPAAAAWSPNITSLAKQGVVLDYHYTHWHCSPSRRSFLTGRLPIHHGEQLSANKDDDIDLRMGWISDKLSQAGYSCHWFATLLPYSTLLSPTLPKRAPHATGSASTTPASARSTTWRRRALPVGGAGLLLGEVQLREAEEVLGGCTMSEHGSELGRAHWRRASPGALPWLTDGVRPLLLDVGLWARPGVKDLADGSTAARSYQRSQGGRRPHPRR